MQKRFKILLSIILPIICITSVCLSFLLPVNNKSNEKVNEIQINKTRYEANYFATADEKSPAQGQSSSYKGGAIFLEPNAIFIMSGGTLQSHTNTYGGAVFISEGATFTMNGGTITGCGATYGGAIYVSAGGTCNINAGTITGNTANYGPSIYAEAGATVNISEDTVIDENSVEIVKNVEISTDTIVVGNPSANFNLHYVDFGSYPQWYVGDTMNTTLENWYSSNSLTSVNTYVLQTRTWQVYKYTDGNLYARGTSRPASTSNTYLSGEIVKGYSEIAWFKVEPIRWVVLNYDSYTSGASETLELLSYFALVSEIQYYPNTTDIGCNEWVNSKLRIWLNDTFYNSAFTELEQTVIHNSTIGNNVNGNYQTETSNTLGTETQDNVYVLSYWDYCNTAGCFGNVSARKICCPTDFALSNYCSLVYGTSTVNATRASGSCHYWTRSAYTGYQVLRIGGDGGYSTSWVTRGNEAGIRPAIQLKV